MVKANHALSNSAQDAINATQAVSRKLSRHRTRIDILCPNNLRYFVIVLSHCVPSMGFFPICSLVPLHSSFSELMRIALGFAFSFSSFVYYAITFCFLSCCVYALMVVFISACCVIFMCLSNRCPQLVYLVC